MSGREPADARWMALALALGRRGQGRVWPNPAVGCVIVRDGRVVGRGWTADGGRPHAEAVALAQAGAAARGATAYVTLEPCAHEGGRGPACAGALVEARVARVVAALADPDPRTAGQGFVRLRAAGIAVAVGEGEAEARRDLAGFLMRVTAGRPLLTLKLAASLDGRIATATGESRWITGEAARHRVQALRATHDAVLVGGGTARADDPALTLRGWGARPDPVRVVASRGLDLPPDGQLARSAAAVPLWLVHGDGSPEGTAAPGVTDAAGADAGMGVDPAADLHSRAAAWRARGARTFAVAADDRGVDPAALLAALGGAGLTRVLCEGGGALAAALVGAGLVDRLAVFHAGLTLGAGGRPMVGALPPGPLAAAPRWRLAGTEAIGGDVLSLWDRAG